MSKSEEGVEDESAITSARVAVFKDKKGNEFIIAGVWFSNEDASRDPADMQISAMMMSVTTGTSVEWRDFPVKAGALQFGVEAINADVSHKDFEHGGFQAFVIAGPWFEANRSEEKADGHDQDA